MVDEKFEYYKDKERITNSMLGWMKVSSAYFKKMFDEYPNEDQDADQYMTFGNAFHCFILEANEFDKRYAILDEPPPSNVVQKKFINTLVGTKEPLDEDYKREDIIEVYEKVYSIKGKSKDFIASAALDLYNNNKSYINFIKFNADKQPITKDDYSRIEKMRKAIMNHDVAKTLMFDKYLDIGWKSANELTLFFNISIESPLFGQYNVPMKCKIDRIIWNEETKEIIIVDLKTNSLKTTRKNYIQALIEDITEEFDYDRQLSLYMEAVRQNLNEFFKEPSKININNYIVAVQTNIVHEARVLQLSEKVISDGFTKAINLITNYAIGVSNGFDHDARYYENKVIII